MAGPPPAVAAVRSAVRRALLEHVDPAPPGPVLVACSGGADSMALAAATRFVTRRMGRPCGVVTVDHQLQEGSDRTAAAVAAWATGAGHDVALVETVDARPRPGGEGPEATARTLRYSALAAAAQRCGATAVLLGHTQHDQAETVLLALARGAGPRGISGMPEARTIGGVLFARPLLAVPRERVRRACAEMGLAHWEDPHNTDPAYARSRLRGALPVLVEALGAGAVANLARTAGLVADDCRYLDAEADAIWREVATPGGALRVRDLAPLPTALRRRVLRRWATDRGATALTFTHLDALDALVSRWKGQGTVSLPGPVTVTRRFGALVVEGVG